MKKMMIMASAVMMTLAANAENMSIDPFEGVNVNVPAHVRFIYGENYAVDVQATDSLVASAIRCTVQDGVLKIRTLEDNEQVENVCITIVSPNEPKMTVGRNMEMKQTNRVRE